MVNLTKITERAKGVLQTRKKGNCIGPLQSNYNMRKNDCQQEILKDISRSGRVYDWATHKINSSYIALAYEDVDPAKAQRMRECAQWLAYRREEDGSMRLHDARFCRVRLCPVCQWRRSLKTYAQMSQILDAATADGYSYIFLTLTVCNCDGAELSDTLTHVLQSYNRLTKYKDVARAVAGYYRGMEVTRNIKDNTYHPHLHCVLAVKPCYWSGQYYLSQRRWSELWRKALRVDYTPIVDVRKCNGDWHSIAEACKYTVKPSDIINQDWDITVDTLRTLDNALAGRRFVGLGGCIKDYHKQLHLDDIENGDFVHSADDVGDDVQPEDIVYWWSGYNQQYIK